MIKLKINSKKVLVEEGSTVYDAAQKAGVEIPVMCHYPGLEHFTSCMVCMVKDRATDRLFPSCSMKAEPDMDIVTDDEEVIEARKTALELLLSEHIGDCEAPCKIACPAHMDIPRMNRLLAKGEFEKALKVVKQDIALPAVMGRICSAPCESVCHRKSIDGPVAICLLKRFAADYDIEKPEHFVPMDKNYTGLKVAIIGAGAAGLSAAYYIQQQGHQCEIFEKECLPGGMIRNNVSGDVLPRKILDQEVELIGKVGVIFHFNKKIDKASFKQINEDFDAVVIACGNVDEETAEWGVDMAGEVIIAGKASYQTNIKKVFAIGNVIKSTKLAIRVVAQGKEVAFSVQQFLNGEKVVGEPVPFNSRFGKLLPEEFDEYLKESVGNARVSLSKGLELGYTAEEVKREAARCLHCDCRELDNCKLRKYANEYHANQKRFPNVDRKTMKKNIQHQTVVYEPGKCIKCGICVRLTEQHKEKLGFTFIGRGFDVEIGAPFSSELNEALATTAEMVAKACPTGAISLKINGVRLKNVPNT